MKNSFIMTTESMIIKYTLYLEIAQIKKMATVITGWALGQPLITHLELSVKYIFMGVICTALLMQGISGLPLAWAGPSWVYELPRGQMSKAQPVWAPALGVLLGKGLTASGSPCPTDRPWGCWGAAGQLSPLPGGRGKKQVGKRKSIITISLLKRIWDADIAL